MNASTSATALSDESRWHSVLHRWPAALGLAAAAFQVVPRSLAEFCMLLDVPLGVGAIVVATV